MQGHAHYIDHVTNIKTAPVRVEWSNPKTGEEGAVDILKPCKILIKADVHHKFIIMVDDTELECWFSEAEAEKAYPGEKVPWHLEKPDV